MTCVHSAHPPVGVHLHNPQGSPTALGSDAADFPYCRGCQTWPQDKPSLAVYFHKAEPEQRYAHSFTYCRWLACSTTEQSSCQQRPHGLHLALYRKGLPTLDLIYSCCPIFTLHPSYSLRKTETTRRWILKTPNTTSTHFLHLYPDVLLSTLFLLRNCPQAYLRLSPCLGTRSHPPSPT